jgi:uncharacterized protein YbjT (DUF2867 family)
MSAHDRSEVLSAPKSQLVLVTGATGQQGGTVARHLLKRGHHVRALVRDPHNPKLDGIRSQGVEAIQGSFDDEASVERAAKGVDAMFLMGTPFGGGAELEARQGKSAVDAAKRAGVPWLVYSSVGDADRKTGIPHFESKFEVEEHLRGSGIPHAISAPTSFMENFLSPWSLSSLREGKLTAGVSADRSIQMVALDDLGAFVTRLLENPSKFHGKRINVASDAASYAEAARTLSELFGRTLEYQRIPIEALRAQNADYAKMFEWFESSGYTADIEGLRREYPQVGWHRFRDWASRQSWPGIKP